MLTTIKPIETVYRGYRFRSRLEARWAVFFEAAGLRWEYEPEGFETPAGWYLPDFRITTAGGRALWFEVKPLGCAADARFTHFSLAHNIALLSGDPIDELENCVPDFEDPESDARYRHAAGVARQARFEHGEAPL